jgi:hypothetical protein
MVEGLTVFMRFLLCGSAALLQRVPGSNASSVASDGEQDAT